MAPLVASELRAYQSTIDFVNRILEEGVKARASDIHLEPTGEELLIRFRVDGLLAEALRLPAHLAPAILSRVKVMANLDIGEQRLPQDGRTFFTAKSGTFDLRVSTIPVIHGEKIALRLLHSGDLRRTLEALGMEGENLAAFRQSLREPFGLILVTGPTGCGKTSTLYAALQTFDTMERNITTLEDPIEYELPLINQTQVNGKTGYTFAQGLRAILRQDPDIILVGEIRDRETARMATQAAMTGHLVLSTLHTQDAVGAVFRLRYMGVEPYLLAAPLRCVVAQRLIRLLCPGGVCSECRGTGYVGRTGVFEVMQVSPSIREAIHAGAYHRELTDLANVEGRRGLWFQAAEKVSCGITTQDEANRVFHGEERRLTTHATAVR